jgi:hypothetical protein
MADDKKPAIVTPGNPPAAVTEPSGFNMNKELDDRSKKAYQAFEQAHSDLGAVPGPEAPAAEVPEVVVPELPLEIAPVETDAPEPVVAEPAETPPPAAAEAEPASASPSAEPAAPPVEKKEPFDWRKFRQQERELRKAQKELAELKAGKAPAPAAPETAEPVAAPAPVEAPAYDESDPFGVKAAAKEEGDRVRRELQEKWDRERAADAQKAELVEIDNQERNFIATHPDYYDAVAHLANYERSRYQRTGAAQVEAVKMMGDPQWQAAIERVADNYVFVPDPNRPNHLLTAERTKLSAEQMATAREMTDADAAVCLATERWIQARRQDVLNGARATRRTVPEVVWDVAINDLGYKPRAAAPAAKANGAPPSTDTRTAAERVRASAKATAASKSLSAVSSSPPIDANSGQQIKTLRDLTDLQRKDPKAFRELNDRMSRSNPSWYRDLPA